MERRVFLVLGCTSLVLLAGTVTLWVMGQWYLDSISYVTRLSADGGQTSVTLGSQRGEIIVMIGTLRGGKKWWWGAGLHAARGAVASHDFMTSSTGGGFHFLGFGYLSLGPYGTPPVSVRRIDFFLPHWGVDPCFGDGHDLGRRQTPQAHPRPRRLPRMRL